MEELVESVRRRKQTIGPLGKSSTAAQVLAARFDQAAPYFFSFKDQCRFRTLALLQFLSLHKVAADWVFGVALAPFRAHCWAEKDGIALNEESGTVQQFRTILRV